MKIGDRVRQVEAAYPEFASRIGREALVVESFMDEKGNEQVRTDDGIWCPGRLLLLIDPRAVVQD